MNYKALFLDVDGTIARHGLESVPSPRVRNALIACKEKGVHVCLATSRPLHVLEKIFASLPIDGLCVVAGGTQIYDIAKKQVIQTRYLSQDKIPELVAVGKQHNLTMGFFDGQTDKHIKDASEIPNPVIAVYYPEVLPKDVDTVTEDIKKIEGIAIHRMPAWDEKYQWLDITDGDATKLHGIVEVARLLGVRKEETIGVGDGYNDFPLLLACGLKIAMGNAVPELKEVADFIAPSVDEDGVAVVVEKFILS